jgi:hypothetical protein
MIVDLLLSECPVTVRQQIKYGKPLTTPIFRHGSPKWGELLRDSRRLYEDGKIIELDEDELFILMSEAGELAQFEGEEVMLDVPFQHLEKPGWTIVYVRTGDKVEKLEVPPVTSCEDVTFEGVPEAKV